MAQTRTRGHRKGVHDERGAALLEFTLVAIPLMLLVLGGVMFGYLLNVKQSVTQAAKEGARAGLIEYANLNASAAEAERRAVEHACDTLDWLEDKVGGNCSSLSGAGASAYDSAGSPIRYFARVTNCAAGSNEAAVRATAPTPGLPQCLFVRIAYDHGDHRILPAVPLIDAVLPTNMTDLASVQLD